ncbi:MAG: hypothetical protein ACX94B_13160 [Henriciella sp.]
MTTLIQRLEQADGADRLEMTKLFEAVFVHFDLPAFTGRSDDLHTKVNPMLLACAWESAALALVAEVLPGWKVGVGEMYITPGFQANLALVTGEEAEDIVLEDKADARHKSPAIALLLALLHATGEGDAE